MTIASEPHGAPRRCGVHPAPALEWRTGLDQSLRPTDPVAERMLHVVLRLERAPWPGARPAYAAALVALSARCEAPAAKAEVYRWFMRETGGLLAALPAARRATARDALHDAIAIMPSLLLRFRAGLEATRRPNLRSMLIRLVRWSARDLHRAQARQIRGWVSWRGDDRAAADNPQITVEAAEVLALLDEAQPWGRALRLVGVGYTVAEAARMTGVSRGQIYAARAALAAAVERGAR